jgi:hypothetical protein
MDFTTEDTEGTEKEEAWWPLRCSGKQDAMVEILQPQNARLQDDKRFGARYWQFEYDLRQRRGIWE